MQVSHVQDHVTHAVIGGRKQIDFGISDSPEFFNILSSTLYSDQELAVAREVLCNAWDAHIEAGCTDRAVEVTITDDQIIFKDYGKGIHDDDMGPRYCTYGASDKKLNGAVTGGFGLGCKAPFCMADHFEVTSSHAGRRTIYKLSKSSAEVNGKPGLTPIASFPTEETGLQVTIPIAKKESARRFSTLVRRIAANGEMNVVVNEDKIKPIPFSSMTDGFLITDFELLEQHSAIHVRYGNVVYPVDNNAAYEDDYHRIANFLSRITTRRSYKIVFQAPPHSISVTPSRESLSMQEHTTETLTKLLACFTQMLDKQFEPGCLEVAENQVKAAWSDMNPGSLFSTNLNIVRIKEYRDDPSLIVNLTDAIKIHVSKQYPSTQSFRTKDLLSRVNSLIESNFGNTGLLKSYRSALLKPGRPIAAGKSSSSSWLHSKIIWPLVRDLNAADLSPSKLFAYTGHPDSRRYGPVFTEVTKTPSKSLGQYLPFLRNIVVLSHNRIDVDNRVANFPIMRHWLGKAEDFLVYIAPRNSNKTAEARAFFEQRGVHLIDLTIAQPWEPKQAADPVYSGSNEPATVRAKGLPLLSSLKRGYSIHMEFLDEDATVNNIVRSEKPVVVMQLPRGKMTGNINRFSEEASLSINELWGDQIGVAVNSTQMRKYQKAGSVELSVWIADMVCNAVNSNATIQEAIAFDHARLLKNYDYYSYRELFEIIYSDDELRLEFGIPPKLTGDSKHYFTLWNQITQLSEYKNYPVAKTTAAFAKDIRINPAVDVLVQKLTNNPLVQMIEKMNVRVNIMTTAPEPAKKITREILIKIINQG